MKNLADISQFLTDYESTHNHSDSTGKAKKRPPVHQWQPTEHFSIDMVIKANGEWWYQGSKMTRQKLVTLFASILVMELDTATHADNKKHSQQASYYLKTPVQQAKITVEDAPLLINEVSVTPMNTADPLSDDNIHYWVTLTTTTEDVIQLDDEHQIYFAEYQGEPRPYIQVRDGLHALISRPVFYHLLELGELSELNEESEKTVLTLYSGGKRFETIYANNSDE